MKWIFGLLLAANVALFAAIQLPQGKAGSEPMAEHAPLHSDNIRLLSDTEAPHAPAAPPTEQAPTATCFEWGQLSEDDLPRAQRALKDLRLPESSIAVHKVQAKSSSYWVYIPPLKSRQEANRKVEELKGMGIDESFVIQDNNKWRYAVSLGIFSSEEGASKYLAQMRAKGVKSAKSAPRNHDGGQASITIKAGNEHLQTDLENLKAEFPASEIKSLECAQ